MRKKPFGYKQYLYINLLFHLWIFQLYEFWACSSQGNKAKNKAKTILGHKKIPQNHWFQGILSGGRYKTRTCDLPHVKRMRYQLRQSSKLSASVILHQTKPVCQYQNPHDKRNVLKCIYQPFSLQKRKHKLPNNSDCATYKYRCQGGNLPHSQHHKRKHRQSRREKICWCERNSICSPKSFDDNAQSGNGNQPNYRGL